VQSRKRTPGRAIAGAKENLLALQQTKMTIELKPSVLGTISSLTSTPSPSPVTADLRQSDPRVAFWRRLTRLALLLALLALLAACGPGEPARSSSADNTQATVDIARAYAASGDLTVASAALGELAVANERQWLVLVAEQAIGGAQDAEATAALVKLAVALNLESSLIRTYAEQNGLQPDMEQMVAAAPTATAAPPTATPEPAVAPTAPPADEPAATMTPAEASALALPTPTAAAAGATLQTGTAINVRGGPGLDYPIVNLLQANVATAITGKNQAGDWWEIALPGGGAGWVLGQLVTTAGDTQAVAVAANIPTPPPAATAAPTAAVALAAPQIEPTATPAAEAPAATATTSPDAQPYFRLVASRMWSKEENGACSGQHLLRINVIDANGVRINGVRLQGIYTGEIMVTGSQGKGDGVIEYDLYGTGEGFRVIQNDDGRPASSDNAEGFTTKSLDISVPVLIAGGYCSDEADCQIFYNSYGCTGHHSWEATFQRNY